MLLYAAFRLGEEWRLAHLIHVGSDLHKRVWRKALSLRRSGC